MLFLFLLTLTVQLNQLLSKTFDSMFDISHPRPTNWTALNATSIKVTSGLLLIQEPRASILFDCVKYDCGSSVLVCTAAVENCFLKCDKYDTCDGVEFYSAAYGITEIKCFGTGSCMGVFINCGPILHRGADGFVKYPGYDKENPAGIRDNSLFRNVEHHKCSMWCGGNSACKESHLDCNGNWTQGCHIYSSNQVDSYTGVSIGARLGNYSLLHPARNKFTLHCDASLACDSGMEYNCLKSNNCTCEGTCDGIKSHAFELVDIPPTAHCKKVATKTFQEFVACRQNFECNVFCKQITCLKCQAFDCNGDDACAGTKDRGLKLGKINIVGEKTYGVVLKCGGDRTCKDQGGITSVSYHLPKSQRGFHITNCDSIVCSGDNSCEASYFDVKCMKGGCYLECGDNACLYSEMHFDWLRRLTCSAQNTCAYLNLTAGVVVNDWAFGCGPHGCDSGIFNIKIHRTVTHIKGFGCRGPWSCRNFQLNIIANHKVVIESVECQARGSCHGARFKGSKLVKWPTDIACGGRRGPCMDFTINGKPVLKPLPKKKTKKTKKKKSKKSKKVPIHRKILFNKDKYLKNSHHFADILHGRF